MPEQPTWSDISSKLDPQMPSDAYDKVRRQYFDNFVKPKLSGQSHPGAAWEDFKTQTDRKPLSTTDSIKLSALQATAGAVKGFITPIARAGWANDPAAQKSIKNWSWLDQELNKEALAKGKTRIPSFVGEIAGSTAPFVASMEATEAAEIPQLLEGKMAQRLLRGSVSFGAFEAASAKEGDRMMAGLKGAALGAGMEGAFGIAGKVFSRGGKAAKGVAETIQDSIQGKTPLDVDLDVADEIENSSKQARREGMPKEVKENPNVKGVNVLVRDASDQPLVVKVRPGAESKALDEIRSYLKSGGEVEGIHYHPDDWSNTQKFMARIANETEEKLTNVKIIRTAENQAKSVATDLRMQDVKATEVGPSEVVVEHDVPKRPTHTDVQARLLDLKDEGEYPLVKAARDDIHRRIDSLWSEAVPNNKKEEIAKSLANWPDIHDLLPSEWVRTSEANLPMTVERGVADEVGEAERIRLEEVVQRAKESGVTNPGVLEEAIRKGEVQFEPAAILKVPDSESFNVRMTEKGPVVDTMKEAVIGSTERRLSMMTSTQRLESFAPGSLAVTVDPQSATGMMEKMGFTRKSGEDVPMVIYPKGVSKSTVYHEGLHVDGFHVPKGKEIMRGIDESVTDETRDTMNQIATEIRGLKAYEKQNPASMREEAFVHAATAIRTNDPLQLSNIVRMDTSIERVTQMVRNVAESLWEAASSSDSFYPARVAQRKMEDLLRRTGEGRMSELRNAVQKLGNDVWYQAPSDDWVILHSNGNKSTFPTLDDLHEYLTKSDGSSIGPSFSVKLEMNGVRGPFVPRGGGPVKDPGPVGEAPRMKWSGWTAISGWIRPMQPWVADLDKRINEELGKKGFKLPIFEKFKNVVEVARASEAEDTALREKVVPLLEGVGKKQYDYFDVLMSEPKHWKQVADRLGLNEQDLNKIAGINNWFTEYTQRTGINPLNYLRDELPRLRGHNYNPEFVYGSMRKETRDMSTFERLIDQGKLDPKNRHIGSFIDTLIREANAKKLRQPLTELRELVDKKARDGSYLLGHSRGAMDNYIKYMQGVPDVTGQLLKETVGNFQQFLGDRAAIMNKHLPDWAQLPTKFQYPGSVINKLMVWSYAAGLGLRASIPVRDALQVFTTTMPVLGPARFGRGLAYLMENGWEEARNAGALLGRKNMGDLYGDIFSEIPVGASTDRLTKIAQKLLSPSRGGHNIGRAVGYYGEYVDALDAIKSYRAGRIDLDQLINDRTHLWFNDEAVQKRMVDLIHSASPEESARQIALELLDITLWPYRRGMQPSFLRTGAGRIFGQFGMWPLNYADFIKRGALKFGSNPKNAMTTTALWAASNYASVQAMQMMGADSEKWFWVSPMGYGLSPHAQLLLDLAKAPEETQDGRAARKRVLEYPLDFFPGSIEAQHIYKVMQSDEPMFNDDGSPTPAFVQILGFRPYKEPPERDIEDQIRFELGFGKKKKE